MTTFAARFVLVVSTLWLLAVPAAAQERLCDASWENCRVPLVALIDNEQVGIDVGVWVIKDARIPAALLRARRRGVPVRMIMDTRADASFAGNAQFIADLAAAGVQMRQRTAGDICHWKLMIFTGQNAMEFSGANYSPMAFVPYVPYVNYEDEVIYFSSAFVPSFMTKFDDIWTNTIEYTDYANVSEPLTRVHPTTDLDPGLNFPPADSYTNRLLPLLDAETSQIDVQVFRWTDDRPIDHLIAALARGVTVNAYIDKVEYRNHDRSRDAYNVDRLYAAGIAFPGQLTIRQQHHDGITHQKTVWLHATQTTIFGTSNWSTASDDNQLEANLFTTDASTWDAMQAIFVRKWTNAAPDGIEETEPFTPLRPDKPVNILPVDTALDVPVAGTSLRWDGGDWGSRYDIYFGDTPDPGLLGSTGSNDGNGVRSFPAPTLLDGHTYYWRIVSYTAAGLFREGALSTFTTAGIAPPPLCADPAATNVGGPLPCTYPAVPPTVCPSVMLGASAFYVGGPEGNWSIAVTTPDSACTWSAVSDADWLIVKSPISSVPSGSGIVKLRAVTNIGSKRQGHVLINGVVYSVTQGGGS
jgi:phosphatidylserine/phosphatidylglycerophosphate/cardiolipin synthase-like enzyme